MQKGCRGIRLSPPAATAAGSASTAAPFKASTAGPVPTLNASAAISSQALLAASAVGSGVASLAITAKCAAPRAPARLLPVTALGLPLVEAGLALLVLVNVWPVLLLIKVRSILLIHSGSVWLIIEVSLATAPLPYEVLRVLISELLLV